VSSLASKLKLWNDKVNAPLDSQEASNFLLGVLSDNILELFLDTDFVASVIWSTLSTKFLVHSLSAQSTAFTALVNFNYSEPSMADNKLALLSLARNLRTSFKDEKTIDIENLVMLFALTNVPTEYHHLRSTLEETNKNANLPNLPRQRVRQVPPCSRQQVLQRTTRQTSRCFSSYSCLKV
jgi:hypothetical protein